MPEPLAKPQLGQDSWTAWQLDPTPERMSSVLKELDPVIVSEVQRYPGPKDILYWKGRTLARDAVRSFDPSRGASLRTWVTTQLRPLNRYGQRLSPVRVPEAVRRQAAEIHTVTNRLHDSLGRMPTDDELADEVGLSKERLRRLRSRAGLTLAEAQLVDLEGNPQMPAVVKAKPTDFATEAVYDALTPQEQLVFDWKTGGHGRARLANKDIAEQLGVSPAYVSQLSQKVAQRIIEASGYAI